MKAKLKKLNKKYNILAKRAMSGALTEAEYERTIDTLQSLEIKIFKLQLTR